VVRLSSALHLYATRLRARLAHEGLVLIGIAAGVALLFAAQIAGASLQSSVAQLAAGIEGRATLQLRARGQAGMPEIMLARVRRIPGVQVAAPLLEAGAQARGPRGGRAVELIGADSSLSRLGGRLVSHVSLAPFGGIAAVVLPSALSRQIGVSGFGQEVTFDLPGRSAEAPLYARLPRRQIGGLAESPMAIAPLSAVQEMTGLAARVSRILVESAPGRRRGVRAALLHLAGGRMNVEPAGYDATLFSTAAAASNRSTELFAVIGALVGFLFAFNAMLLASPGRRAFVAILLREGFAPAAVTGMLLLDACVLGVLASLCGLALGQELSIHLLHADPTFLSLAFTIGPQRAVSWQSVAIALSGGMLAAAVGVLGPLAGTLRRAASSAVAPRDGGHAAAPPVPLAILGVAALGASGLILTWDPGASIAGMTLLLIALLLVLPLALSTTLRVANALASPLPGVAAHVARIEMAATRSRAHAIAATGAVAVFACVAIQGAHGDLLAGLVRFAVQSSDSAQVWVSPRGSYDVLDTAAFTPAARRGLQALPGVRSVLPYRGGLLDYGRRRVMVLAPPSQARTLLPASELLTSDPVRAQRRLREGGWLVLSKAIAEERGLRVGESFMLPSPVPRRFRIAALSTNLGWAPGAIIMNADDYARAWDSDAVSAFGVRLAPGVSSASAIAEIDRAVGPSSALLARSSQQRADAQRALDRQALARLSQIAVLIPAAAVLAMAASIGAMIWQRRPRLAKLKLDGLTRGDLWATVLIESAMLLGSGCLSGAVFGLFGQQLADRALASAVNFPIVYSVGFATALASIALVTTAAVIVLAILGYMAASAPAALALAD
jgi:putative ABC transport system permease protein